MQDLRDAFIRGFIGGLRLHLAIVLAPLTIVKMLWNEFPRYQEWRGRS